jgi:hypothetical protein
VQAAVNDGLGLLIFVLRAAHSHDSNLSPVFDSELEETDDTAADHPSQVMSETVPCFPSCDCNSRLSGMLLSEAARR